MRYGGLASIAISIMCLASLMEVAKAADCETLGGPPTFCPDGRVVQFNRYAPDWIAFQYTVDGEVTPPAVSIRAASIPAEMRNDPAMIWRGEAVDRALVKEGLEDVAADETIRIGEVEGRLLIYSGYFWTGFLVFEINGRAVLLHTVERDRKDARSRILRSFEVAISLLET